jgi:ATP-dependent protease ClpP protease subunit
MRRQFPKAKGSFYEVQAAVRAESEPSATDLWIYDIIGDDWYDPSLTAKELCQTIAAIDTDEIVLHLASPGGSASDGMAIYNALASHPAKVTSRVEGWTGSIATVVALAGEQVLMFDNCFWAIHNPLGIEIGDARVHREYADFLDQVAALMTRVYMERCTKTEDELGAALEAETHMSAEEAAEWGWVDEVLTGAKAAAALDPSVLEAFGWTAGAPGAAGRTLSAENEGKLREARTMIDEALATLDGRAPDPGVAGSGDAPATMDRAGLASLYAAAKRH